ncbi:MAG: hypothetical protein IRZ03_17355 [Acidobacterium ailaaui]|nr:hypothetical protein [Pseudacidobacterium ailaaui]
MATKVQTEETAEEIREPEKQQSKKSRKASKVDVELLEIPVEDSNSDDPLENPPSANELNESIRMAVVGLWNPISELGNQIREQQKIIDLNTLSEDGVRAFIQETDIPEIAEMRDKTNALKERMEQLRKEYEELGREYNKLYTELKGSAEIELTNRIDTLARTRAQEEKRHLGNQLRTMITTIKNLPGISGTWVDWARVVENRYCNVNGKPRSTTSLNAEQKDWMDRVRRWGINTGWTNPVNGNPVADRGRLPERLIQDYLTAHPGDTFPE